MKYEQAKDLQSMSKAIPDLQGMSKAIPDLQGMSKAILVGLHKKETMKLEHIEKDATYHIYNRGINSTRIFKNSENKRYFLSLFQKYLGEKVTIFAYCLMDTHYHFLVKITEDEKVTTQSFSNLFNAYAKAFNKQEKRTGSLFEKHFKRKRITDETYLTNLFCYIHNNPVSTKENYLFSSYVHYLEQTQPEGFTLDKTLALQLFDTIENMRQVTQSRVGDDDSVDLQGPLREDLAGQNKTDAKPL